MREDKISDGSSNGLGHFNSDKGLVMVEIDLKKPMKITFMNKSALKTL
jgi:hypothetical protein